MFTPKDLQLERGWPGIIEGDTVVQLAAQTLQAFFTGGGTARRHAEYPLADIEFRPPVLHPPAVRDFYAFEQHVKTARALRGQEVPPEWYEIPVFYFSNPAAIYGPEDEIPHPPDTKELDYELEVAAIDRGRRPDRRLHDHERLVRARSSARGDEGRAGTGEGQGLRHQPRARARDAGRVRRDERRDGRARERRGALAGQSLPTCYHSWDAIVAHAARNTHLRPGDVLGSGTVGTGCILEHGDGRWLQRGDVVELEIEGIGVLRNRVA